MDSETANYRLRALEQAVKAAIPAATLTEDKAESIAVAAEKFYKFLCLPAAPKEPA